MACYPDYYTMEDARRDYGDHAWTTYENNRLVTYPTMPEYVLRSLAHDLIKRGDDDFRASNRDFIKFCWTIADCDTMRRAYS